MTVPSCQSANKGKKRSIILLEMERNMSSAPRLTPYIPTSPARHTLPGGSKEPALAPPGILQSLSHPSLVPLSANPDRAGVSMSGGMVWLHTVITHPGQTASVVNRRGSYGEPLPKLQAPGGAHMCSHPSPCFCKAWLKGSRHNHLLPTLSVE